MTRQISTHRAPDGPAVTSRTSVIGETPRRSWDEKKVRGSGRPQGAPDPGILMKRNVGARFIAPCGVTR